MLRVRVSGGVLTPEQWLALDRVARDYGNGTMRLTTRQTVQLHGVIKSNLKSTLKAIDTALLNTIAACGDVNRNVMCNPNPFQSRAHAGALELARAISDHLTPRTGAYREIWLDGEKIAGGEPEEARADLRQDLSAAEVQDRGGGAAVERRRRVHQRSELHRHRRRCGSDRRLERHGRRRHGHDARRAGHLSPHRRHAGLLPDRQMPSRSPKPWSRCSATGATGPTASTRGSNTPSRIAGSTRSGPRSRSAPG